MSYTKLPMELGDPDELDGLDVYSDTHLVARFCRHSHTLNTATCMQEDEANARLFVHAGKMLEMLEMATCVLSICEQTLIHFQDCGEPIDSVREVKQKITNLIAAAKGEA